VTEKQQLQQQRQQAETNLFNISSKVTVVLHAVTHGILPSNAWDHHSGTAVYGVGMLTGRLSMLSLQ